MTEHSDVLIVGYGPVGQVLALLLAERGRRVTAVERWPQAYPMPRAVAFDGEGARILSVAGISEPIGKIGEPSGEYFWKNAADEVLLHIDGTERRWCGWPESTSMYQPALEAELQARAAVHPGLAVHRGYEVVRLTESPASGAPDADGADGAGVEAVAVAPDGTELRLSASWVVGCDGANSFVRQRIGADVADLGFGHDWLICDVEVHDGREFSPNNLQVCDPARPRTAVSAGPGHRRYEFMRVAGETVEELDTAESAWRLLRLFDVAPENATLRRHHVYSFEAGYARTWHAGRMVLAGDAAHVMPPFAGQGMTSGFRDANALAWRLDAVLAGRADPAVLGDYEEERRAHVKHAIGMSVNLGRIICQTDPAAAADRDKVMLATARRAAAGNAAAGQRSPLHPLKRGFLHLGEKGRPVRPAGALAPQARVATAGGTGLFDDVVGTGFVFLSAAEPGELLDAAARDRLREWGAHLVRVLPAGTPAEQAGAGEVVDVDDVYLPFLAGTDAAALLIRPDFYVYGGAAGPAAAADLVADAYERLRGTRAPVTA
ncbi:bifunctional 3-(3-hydroxy-phenyl)propionate/3-hydroxycinnamic acid hydroxylase MhpA [Streptomyces aculeolatus]